MQANSENQGIPVDIIENLWYKKKNIQGKVIWRELILCTMGYLQEKAFCGCLFGLAL